MKKKPYTLIRIMSILLLAFLAACNRATPVNPPLPTLVTDLVPAGASLRLSHGPLLFADVSRDGKTVIVGGQITLCSYQVKGKQNWCSTTGEAAESTLRGLVLTPDGKTLLTGLENGSLILWDSASGRPRWVTQQARLNSAAWSPDSHEVIISTQDLELRILAAATGAVKAQIHLEGVPPTVLSWSPDGKMIAAGDDSGQVNIYDAQNGGTIMARHFFPDQQLPSGLAWSTDSKLLLAAASYISCYSDCNPTYDGWIVQVEARSGQVKWQIDVKDQVHSLTPGPDGTTVLARVGDNALNLYQVKDGSLVQSINDFSGFGPFWLPDGKSFLSLDGKANLVSWDLSGSHQTLSHLEGYYGLVDFAWSPNSQQLAASPAGDPVTIWDASTGKLLKTFGEGSSDGPIAWSPDGQQIATFHNQQVIIWDAASGNPVKNLDTQGNLGDQVVWSPDGSLLAGLSHTVASKATNSTSIGTWASSIILWDTSTWAAFKPISIPSETGTGNAVDIAWSPDGKQLAGVGNFFVWDVVTGKNIVNWRSSDQYETVQWSPDGNTVLLGGRRTLIIDANLFSRVLYDIKGMSSCVFSPDGKYLATAWDQIVLHSPNDGSSIQPLDGAADRPERLSFSPDSKTLASLSNEDGTIILWKVP